MTQFVEQRLRDGVVAIFTLFASAGTLLCCALPIVLVTLGLGTVVIVITGAFPWLFWFGGHKGWLFTISASLLVTTTRVLFRRGRDCPLEPAQTRVCERLDRWNRRTYWVAVVLWVIGFFSAYLLLPLTLMFEASE
jgi:uncharacterized membrane protein